MDRRIVQFPQCGKEAGGEGIYVCLQTVGQGIAAFVQGQFLLEAQHPVTGFKMGPDIGRGFLPAAGNTGALFCAPEGTHPHLRNNGAHFCAPEDTHQHLRNTGAQFCAPEELTALVVGAGGAGKAAALAVKDMGMEVYFANRSSSAAKPFAQKIGAEYVTLDHIPLLLPKADIVVYNLSMEIAPLKDVSLAGKIVFEANYAHPNLACKESKIYIDGRYWLYNQAIPAFRLFTGEEPDATAMAQVLGL